MMNFPQQIADLISDETYRTEDIGMSGSFVLIFQDKVLKVQEFSKESENEYRMMKWLKGQLPVPEVLAYEVLDEKSFLLMSRCDGEMACSEKYMRNSEMQVRLLAEGIKKLWNVDISDCPSDCSLKNKLALAAYNVENGLVDMNNVAPDTFGENGFENPGALLQWLYHNQPEEELTLSHGDYCLPNVFFKDSSVAGYIDLGKTGIADRWCDIALCYRSLTHNYNGQYGGHVYSGLDDLMLFRELGIEPDWYKIRYYILLDELF